MRFSALGCMGNAVVKTPHLDRLAEQGLLLENAFSCSPVCGPYRAQLMTGRYGHSTGVIKNDIKLPSEEITIAEVLKGAGYATGYIGKWHLSGGRVQPWGTPERAGYVNPEDRQGWDYWAALECKHRYYDTLYYLNSPEPVPVKGYEPEVQTDLAIEYMRQHRDRPFCLMLSYGPPHNPYLPPAAYDTYEPEEVPLRPNVPKDQEQTVRKNLAQYYGLVTSLDDNMGRLMQTLDELGLADNTIVCFSSDHGDMLGSQGHVAKQRPWEESIHIPFLLRYPRRIKAGQRRDTLFASVDVMPTLLGLCNAPIPAKVQGVDLSAHFLGRSNDAPAFVFFANTHHDNGPGSDWRGIRTKEWMYAYAAEGDWVLYNVSEDPYELNNLIGDPAHQAKRDDLRALLDTRRSELGDAAVLQGTLQNWKNRKARVKKRVAGLLCAGLLMGGTSVFAAERGDSAEQLARLLKRFPEADTDINGILTAEETREVVRKSRSGTPHAALYRRFGWQFAMRMGDWKLVKASKSKGFPGAVPGDWPNLKDAEPEKVKLLG
jgi:arylsulfatase A-like enzyme